MNGSDYVNGVIAVRETTLLSDKLDAMATLSAKEIFKQLSDLPYGQGNEANGEEDYKKLIAFNERQLLSFITEFAPSESEKAFFLLKYDYENLKAIVKSDIGGLNENLLFGQEGLYEVAFLKENYLGGSLPTHMQKCVNEIKTEQNPDGAFIGEVFLRYYYIDLLSRVKKKLLRDLIKKEADTHNVLKVLRTKNFAESSQKLLKGSLPKESFLSFADEEKDLSERINGLGSLKNLGKIAIEKGLVQAEKQAEEERLKIFSDRKYTLSGCEPFVWYVLRRINENKNVSILFSGKLAGLNEEQIRQRFRRV